MNDQQKKEQYSGVRDQEIRAALDQYWAASDANDFETEHRIYHENAVLEYPQSSERTRGRRNIQNQRASQPSKKRFAVRFQDELNVVIRFGTENAIPGVSSGRFREQSDPFPVAQPL
jgi:hypothetical protein